MLLQTGGGHRDYHTLGITIPTPLLPLVTKAGGHRYFLCTTVITRRCKLVVMIELAYTYS